MSVSTNMAASAFIRWVVEEIDFETMLSMMERARNAADGLEGEETSGYLRIFVNISESRLANARVNRPDLAQALAGPDPDGPAGEG